MDIQIQHSNFHRRRELKRDFALALALEENLRQWSLSAGPATALRKQPYIYSKVLSTYVPHHLEGTFFGCAEVWQTK
jgi:hypothetical protein